ncbi:MAG: hypothetical protein IPK99_16450 [Flavobacteriales bacterium]|nr:hypothetical protein [Flavobacteriales bacterium]
MAQILIRLSLLVIALLAAPLSWATHIRGAEIHYSNMGGNSYAITVHFYLDPNSPADRPEVLVDMGDGTIDTLPRLDIIPLPGAGCETSLNIYGGDHTFPGYGTYVITMRDANRNAGILNIPNSDQVELCARAVLVIDALNGANSSAAFNTPQTELGYEFSTLVHQPSAVDPSDGDSLSFDLVTPRGTDCQEIPGYVLPSDATPGNDFAWVDPLDGSFHWHYPQLLGEFVIAIRCREWRNGTMVGEVVRDMTLCISALPSSVEEGAAENEDNVIPLAEAGLYRFIGKPGTRLRITDMAGHLVTESTDLLIDLRNVPKGIYVVRGSRANSVAWSQRLVNR